MPRWEGATGRSRRHGGPVRTAPSRSRLHAKSTPGRGACQGAQSALAVPAVTTRPPHEDLDRGIAGFLLDREARGLSLRTVEFYRRKLASFLIFLIAEGIRSLPELTPATLRRFFLGLALNHNPGGVDAFYRAVRAFLLWWEKEEEPSGWVNPMRKVRPPRVALEPLEPIPIQHIRRMSGTCRRRTFLGDRDRAILFSLLDTGARAAEFLAVDHGDLDISAGQILIRCGKGGKPRMVFLGAKSRRALACYLRHFRETDESAPLWVTRQDRRLSYSGLRDVVRRRARRAGVPAPSLHGFRRTFALACLRGGMDVYSLQRLMGHADLTVLRRYLAQTTEDTRNAHQRSGPVDRLL